MTEIKIYGRAGQGAKTMAQFLAEVVLLAGKFSQAFPSYGPEREGAEMNSFVRLDEKPISIYSQIYQPDVAVVIDQTLMSAEVFASLKRGGILLINADSTFKLKKNKKKVDVYRIDASSIAEEILGKDLPNTILLGALAKILKFDLEDLLKVVKEKFIKKLGQEMTEKNLTAIKKGHQEIKKIN